MIQREKGAAVLLDMTLWNFLQPGAHYEPDLSALKNAVNNLCRITTQKAVAQRMGEKATICWGDLEQAKFTIICEATLLVLTGKLDELTSK